MVSDIKGYYKLLGVSTTASENEIKKAYNKKIRDYHPEGKLAREIKKLPEHEQEKKKKELCEKAEKINEARAVLTDSEKRKIYDSGIDPDQAHQGGGGHGNFNFEDIFEMFSGGGRRGGRQQKRKVKDTVVTIDLALDIAYYGGEKKFKVNRNIRCRTCSGKGAQNITKCTHCNGRGQVNRQVRNGPFVSVRTVICDACEGEKFTATGPLCRTCNGNKMVNEPYICTVPISKGIANETHVKVDGKGDEYPDDDVIPGDLIFTFKIKDMPNFKRVGKNIITTANIDLYTLVNGGYILVEHLRGEKIKVRVPPTKNISKRLVIKNMGLTGSSTRHMNSNDSISDLIINLNIINYNKQMFKDMKVEITGSGYVNKDATYIDGTIVKDVQHEEEREHHGHSRGRGSGFFDGGGMSFSDFFF